jgi:adenylate kinase
MRVVLLGPPGSGKGTHGQRLAKALGTPVISTGDILREAIAQQTRLGQAAQADVKSGRLVADETVLGLIETRLGLTDAKNGFILDGFPRTLAQAQALDSTLAELDRGITSVPVFELGLAQLLERVGGRRVCREAEHVYHLISAPPKTRGICDIDGSELYQRDDDTEPVIRARYQKQWVEAARPVVDHYDAAGLVVRIDAGGTREQVSAEIDALLARLGDGS